MGRYIYITYCSKQKIENMSDKSMIFLPSQLYTSYRVQKFINFCEKNGHTWAIFSDQYGLVLNTDKIKWYDKAPDCVTVEEYEDLLKLSLKKLNNYNDIIFFYKAETFHPLYKKFVNDLKQHKYVAIIDRLEDFNAE